MWKQVGNKIALEPGYGLAPRRALTDNKKASIAFVDYPDRRCSIPSNPQICNLRSINSVSHCADLNDAVSRLFPSSPDIVGNEQSLSLAQLHAGSILCSSIRPASIRPHQRQAPHACLGLDRLPLPCSLRVPKKAGGRGERECDGGRYSLMILTSHKKDFTMPKPRLCRWKCGRKTDRRCGICLPCCDERDRKIAGDPYVPPSQLPGHRFKKSVTEAQKAALVKARASKQAFPLYRLSTRGVLGLCKGFPCSIPRKM